MNQNNLIVIPTHIKITNKSRITNPYNKGTANKFYGNVADFDFNHQSKNYEQLTEKLLEINVTFDKISSSSIERHINQSIQYGTTFIVTTTNPCVYWYKYESNAFGSGGNHMLINGKKIKVTEFLKLSKDNMIKLINNGTYDSK